MSTIYTLNGKVLKNSATDKWLAKKEAPAGFVMNASNAQYDVQQSFTYLYWESPSFPNGYDGNGKQCVIVNNGQRPNNNLMYASSSNSGGPIAIARENLVTGTTTMLVNMAGTASGYGKYLEIPFNSEEDARAWVANVTITILDA